MVRVCAGTLGVGCLILLNMVLVLAVEVVIKTIADSLGLAAVGFLLGANLQGLLILGFRWLAEKFFRVLNDAENWKTAEQFQASYVSKVG